MRPKGAHPPVSLVRNIFLFMAVFSASAAAFPGIGAANAGFAPFFCTVQIQQDTGNHGQDNGRNKEVSHDALPAGTALLLFRLYSD